MSDRILVIDADVQSREFLYELISEIGHTVLTMPAGKEALDCLAREPVRFVFLEDTPGEYSGMLLAQKIHRLSPATNIVLLGPKPRGELLENEFQQLGIVAYLRKNFQDPEVIRSIASFLNPERAESVRSKRIRVLVVDDELESRQTVGRYLSRRGFIVETALSGEECLEKMRHGTFEAVVLDIMMGGMDGLLTLKRIREYAPAAKVIMATAVQNKNAVEQAAALGAAAYINKPFHLEQLEVKLLSVLSLGR